MGVGTRIREWGRLLWAVLHVLSNREEHTLEGVERLRRLLDGESSRVRRQATASLGAVAAADPSADDVPAGAAEAAVDALVDSVLRGPPGTGYLNGQAAVAAYQRSEDRSFDSPVPEPGGEDVAASLAKTRLAMAAMRGDTVDVGRLTEHRRAADHLANAAEVCPDRVRAGLAPAFDRLEDGRDVERSVWLVSEVAAANPAAARPAVDSLVDCLDGESEDVRKAAAEALAAFADDDAAAAADLVPTFARLLDDEAVLVRRAGLDGLSGVLDADPSAATAVAPHALDCASDPDGAVRRRAADLVEAAAEADPAALTPHVRALAPLLRSESGLERGPARRAVELVAEHDPDALGPLVADVAADFDRWFDADDPDAAIGVLDLFEAALTAAPETVRPFVDRLPALTVADDERVRSQSLAAYRSVLETDLDAASDPLAVVEPRLEDPDAGVRREAVKTVGTLAAAGIVDADRALDLLRPRLDDESPYVRTHAVEALADVGTAAATAALEARLETEPEEWIRAELEAALEDVEGAADAGRESARTD